MVWAGNNRTDDNITDEESIFSAPNKSGCKNYFWIKPDEKTTFISIKMCHAIAGWQP